MFTTDTCFVLEQWLIDEDKLTFIILARNGCWEGSHDSSSLSTQVLPHEVLSSTDTHVVSLPMIGDVNIFLKGAIPHLSNHLDFQRPKDPDEDVFEAEVEIMVAGEFC